MKPENILLNFEEPKIEIRAYIAERGVSKSFKSEISLLNNNSTETLLWMSPEMLESLKKGTHEKQHLKSDIFSLGLIAMFCLDYENFQTFKDKLNNNEEILEEYLDDFCYRINDAHISFFYLIRCMLSFSKFTRPNILELCKHFQHFTRPLPLLKEIGIETNQSNLQNELLINEVILY